MKEAGVGGQESNWSSMMERVGLGGQESTFPAEFYAGE